GSQTSMQLPATQLSTHARPQAPQLVALVLRLASQPLVASPSQSPKPALHDSTLQAPPEHTSTAFCDEHGMPQAPQLAASVSVLGSPPQAPKPTAQAPVQMPAAQVGFGTCSGEQARPQPPQLLTSAPTGRLQPSLCWSPLQSAKPGWQAPAHTPPTQATD